MPASVAIDDVVARSERVIQNVLLALARELRVRIRELDTKAGRFVKDQGRVTLALADEVRTLARARAPEVVRELVGQLAEVLRETLRDHPELGPYNPRVTADLQRIFRGGAEEVARVISDEAAEEVASALERVIGAGARIEEASGPVATALDTTRRRAVTAVERAVREFHEESVKGMGRANGLGFAYAYVGPPATSPNIRPYCAARVGKVLTQEQADALEPRERFNCRHSLAPITPEEVLRRGLPRFEG